MTLGVPRLNEVLNVAKNIKTPSVTINIRKADDEEEASDLISQVRLILLYWCYLAHCVMTAIGEKERVKFRLTSHISLQCCLNRSTHPYSMDTS